MGAYKAAVEPYTRTDMSPEAREANRAMIDELWQDYIAKVAANRKLTLDQMNDYVLHYEDLLKAANGDMARVALEHGLVDALMSRDEMRERLIAKVGESEGTFRQIASTDYLRATRPVQTPTDNEVGVVVASGMILPGEQPRGSIGADSLTELDTQRAPRPAREGGGAARRFSRRSRDLVRGDSSGTRATADFGKTVGHFDGRGRRVGRLLDFSDRR